MNAMNRAVFLDRDGTLIEERHYLKDPAEVVIFPEQALPCAGCRMPGSAW